MQVLFPRKGEDLGNALSKTDYMQSPYIITKRHPGTPPPRYLWAEQLPIFDKNSFIRNME